MSASAVATLASLDGRVAVVAGGAGAIGSAVGARLVESGARVYSLDQPGREPPTGVTPIEIDITRADAMTAALAHIDRQAGRLDVVVHAAGITRDGRLWKLTPEDWRDVLATNLDSAFYLLHAAVPLVRRTGAGSIVLVSSINGDRGKAGLAPYAASKAGMNALVRTAARELGGFEIRVNAVAPGWVKTPMTANLPEALHQRARDESALGRIAEPDDVARAVLFLATDWSRHVTGQVLRVDGGQLMGST